MTFTNEQIAHIRSIAVMTKQYVLVKNGEYRQANYEEVMRNTNDDVQYFDRVEWLERVMPEVRKATGIIAFASK